MENFQNDKIIFVINIQSLVQPQLGREKKSMKFNLERRLYWKTHCGMVALMLGHARDVRLIRMCALTVHVLNSGQKDKHGRFMKTILTRKRLRGGGSKLPKKYWIFLNCLWVWTKLKFDAQFINIYAESWKHENPTVLVKMSS